MNKFAIYYPSGDCKRYEAMHPFDVDAVAFQDGECIIEKFDGKSSFTLSDINLETGTETWIEDWDIYSDYHNRYEELGFINL
jgi:hypothetical protein